MKNFSNSVIIAIVALALAFTVSSCKKHTDDPAPINQNTTNVAPTVSTTETTTSSSASITVTASDVDGSIAKIYLMSGSIKIDSTSSSTHTFVINSLTTGTYSYNVKAVDNKGASTITPVSFTITSGGTTNHAPKFDASSLKIVANGSAQTFSLPVSDVDGNTITITSITGTSSNVTLTYSGSSVTVTPKNKNYAGTETLAITISDGTTTATSSFTVNVGETTQVSTYNSLHSYLNKSLSGLVGSSTLTETSIITTATQSTGAFFTTNTVAGTYSYQITSGGTVVFTVGSVNTEYSVQDTGSALVLTNTQNSSKIYTLR